MRFVMASGKPNNATQISAHLFLIEIYPLQKFPSSVYFSQNNEFRLNGWACGCDSKIDITGKKYCVDNVASKKQNLLGIVRSSILIGRQSCRFGMRLLLLFVGLVESLIVDEVLHFDYVDGFHVGVRRVNEDVKLSHYNSRGYTE